MEFVNEGIALGVDLLILGFCVREYIYFKRHSSCLKAAPILPINAALRDHVASLPDKKIPYAIVRGTVTPVGVPIRSALSPAVTGVLQILKLSEHRIARGFAGFWAEQQNLIHIASNEIPFQLVGSGGFVEIVDPLSAALLDLDVVYDNYEPSIPSYMDHFLGFFTGIRHKGLQTTEEVLREGSVISAIGELELDGDVLRLQSSPVGPLMLTTSTKASLIKQIEEGIPSTVVRIVICGTIATVLLGFIARKFYLRKMRQREERRMKETLEKERRARRALARPRNLSREQLCVVCSQNPKEIIILPCGHVCLCEDCGDRIRTKCPVCRGKIVRKAAAFIT